MSKYGKGKAKPSEEMRRERHALLTRNQELEEKARVAEAKVEQLTGALAQHCPIAKVLEQHRLGVPPRGAAEKAPSRNGPS